MAMPIVTMSLPVNVFMTALVAKAFPLPLTTIGLISAMPFVGNFLQIFIAPFLARRKPPKVITVTSAWLHFVTWIALGVFLPLVPHDNPTVAGRCFLVWFLVSSFFSAVTSVSWNAWIQEWVPSRIRGKFFGRRNATLQCGFSFPYTCVGPAPTTYQLIAFAADHSAMTLYHMTLHPQRLPVAPLSVGVSVITSAFVLRGLETVAAQPPQPTEEVRCPGT